MSSSKHNIPPTAVPSTVKRAKKAGVDIDIPSQLKGTSFKFKARPNQDGDFQAWLFDIIVTAFPTAAGKNDEVILDVKVEGKKKKQKPFDFAKAMAAMQRGDWSVLEGDEEEEDHELNEDEEEDDDDEEGDDEEEEDDDDDDDMSQSHAEDDPYYDGLDEEEEEIPNSIGSVFARIVHRHRIRSTFWREMEEPSQDTSTLAFAIFDRYGCLRPEFVTGSSRGSGTFANELNTGSFLQVEMINVKEDHRRRGLASTLLKVLLDQVVKIEDNFLTCSFVFPAFLHREIPDDLPKAEKEKLADEKLAAAVCLYRKAGFRRVGDSVWFAYSFDDSHPSRSVAINDDYNDPTPPTPMRPLQKLVLQLQRQRTTYEHGFLTIDISDKFRGYTDDVAIELLTLRGIPNPTPAQLQRAKYGCTCNTCLSGYLSPRMRVLLRTICEYENDQDMYDEDMWSAPNGAPKGPAVDPELEAYMFPPSWDLLPASVKPYMKSNKSIRKGHRLLFGHIIACLDQSLVPTVANIAASVDAAGEWPPACKNFIERAGVPGIESVIRFAIETSAEKDLKAGGGLDVIFDYEQRMAREAALTAAGKDPAEGEDRFGWVMRNMAYEDGAFEWDLMRKEKECRNDSEFGFLLGMLTGKEFEMGEYNR